MSQANIANTGPITWTSIGIQRDAAHVAAQKSVYDNYIVQTEGQCGHGGFSDDGASVDRSVIMNERTRFHELWKKAEAFHARLREAAQVRSNLKACTGLRITGTYLDEESIEYRGKTETFLRGGIGESDSDALLRTYSADSPLGRAVVNKEVGDTCTVRLPNGKTHEFEITAIDFLTPEDIEAASTMRPRNEQTSPTVTAQQTGLNRAA